MTMASETFPKATTGYVSKAEVVAFLKFFNKNVSSSDITDTSIGASRDIINKRTDTYWGIYEGDLCVDGRGEKHFYAPILPIIYVGDLRYRNNKCNNDETALVPNGSLKNVWWDKDTGRFEQCPNVFPEIINGITLCGKFGEEAPELIKQIQLLLILKEKSITEPATYKTDLLEEKIGRYHFKVGVPSNQAEVNQKKGIDGYIEWMFSMVDTTEKMDLECI
jgi:hypothetical protein